MPYVEVALPIPLRKNFTYSVAGAFSEKVERGVRVAVSFGRRKVPGYVIGEIFEPPEGVQKIKSIAGVLDETSLFPEELLSFLEAAAGYYMHALGEVLHVAAPALSSEALKRLRKEGFLNVGEKLKGSRVSSRPSKSEALRAVDLEQQARASLQLTDEQENAVHEITQAMTKGQAAGFLLHGVTGSGKTEVYLRLIAEVLRTERSAIVLVPEIALTPQLVARFTERFGDRIAVLHSGLSPRERNRAWWQLRRGEKRIAIGARSALFAPVKDLGLIIVDEEHDPSFKQEDGFRYQARDMAMLRAHRSNTVCVLGSATPSLESYRLAQRGKLKCLTLSRRARGQLMPKVSVIDLRQTGGAQAQFAHLSKPLYQAIEKALERHEQAIVFLNRRGFAPTLRCQSCGNPVMCPACSVALTEHRAHAEVRCHYCDFRAPARRACSSCGHSEYARIGIGTEALEKALLLAYPNARVARLDRDTADFKSMTETLAQLEKREIDLLVGTQMVTKGHDLPSVTVVGVVLADQGLIFPDFRAAERTFQLLAQVAGRSGRGEALGEVIFQTYQPTHIAIRAAAVHDYSLFAKHELALREELGYPPFGHLIAVRVDAPSETETLRVTSELGRIAKLHPFVHEEKVEVLGPAPAPLTRLRGRYRYRLLIRGADRAAVRAVAATLLPAIDGGFGRTRASLDIDPVNML